MPQVHPLGSDERSGQRPATGMPDTVGRRIQESRHRLRLSQRMVAEQLGVSRAAYAQWELDVTAPDLTRVRQLARVLEASPEWLAFGVASQAEPDVVWVEELDYGAEPSTSTVVARWGIPSEKLKRDGVLPENARIVSAPLGALRAGPPSEGEVLVDVGSRIPSPPGLYAFWDGVGVNVGPMALIPAGQEAYETALTIGGSTVVLPRDRIHIIGRVVRNLANV